MEFLFEWGYLFIQSLQSYRNPFFDLLFQLLTFTGNIEFYLIFLPTCYWMINKRLGTHFAVLFVTSTYINFYLKYTINQPRPSASRVTILSGTEQSIEPGLPSGHAQNGMTLWGFFGKKWRKRWVQAIMAFLIVGGGISRLYLGAHFPHDVLVGWVVGLIILFLYFKLSPPIETWLSQQTVPLQMIVPTALSILLLLLFNHEDIVDLVATFCGLGLGVPLEIATVQYKEHSGSLLQRLARYLLGLVILILIWRGLKPFLPDDLIGNFIRYALIGFWIAFGAPWAFVKSGLAQSKLATD